MLVQSAPCQMRIFPYTVSDVRIQRYDAMTRSKNEAESCVSIKFFRTAQ